MEKELWKSERIERWERIEKDNRTMKLTLGVKKSELEAQGRTVEDKVAQILGFDKSHKKIELNLTSQKNLYKELEQKFSKQRAELEIQGREKELLEKQIFQLKEEQSGFYVQNMNMVQKCEQYDQELKSQMHYTDCQDLTIKKLKNGNNLPL